jgi:predicted ATPase/DNA-binding winged helix-turn-helix (wHTH) protein
MTSATSPLCTFASAHQFDAQFIRFGDAELDIGMRLLRRGGRVLALGSRAFDLLATLALAKGRIVPKNELMETVWPNTIVDENTLHVHLSTIRKALGQDSKLIVTVPRRGYQLIAPPPASALTGVFEPGQDGAPRTTMASLRGALIGRDTAIDDIRAMLETTRVLTLAGAGGIGKTSIALEIARRAASDCADDVRFVELADHQTAREVLLAFDEVCGAPDANREPDLDATAALLGQSPCLIVIDNAEHVIDPVAQLLERTCRYANAPRFLVTSRRPLRIPAEVVYRVTPLAVSDETPETQDETAPTPPAVALFLRTLSRDGRHIAIDGERMQCVANICRRLDGVPLAIELAAARAAILGLEPVLRSLADPLLNLDGGYRTARARQKSLRASIGWSFQMLARHEQIVFQRLCVFDRAFDVHAACAMSCDDGIPAAAVMECVSELVDHSLLDIHFDEGAVTYSLLAPSRSFGREKLAEAGELTMLSERHARYVEHAACPAPALQPVAPTHHFWP